MNSPAKQLEAIISTIAQALRNDNREANFGAQESIRWTIDEENRKIAFMGKILDNLEISLPTYYDYSHLVKLSRQDFQLQEALSSLASLGYEIVLWREDEDLEGRNVELDFEFGLHEYKQLLITFPPRVINNQKEADRVARFVKKIFDDLDLYTQAKDAYFSLLSLLLNDWEARKSSKNETPPQLDPPDNIPF